MDYNIGKSIKSDIKSAVTEATDSMVSPRLVLFFSGVHNFKLYAEEMKIRFPQSILMGATTFAGFNREGALKDGLLVMGFNSGIECCGDIIEEADRYPIKYIDRIKKCVDKIGNTQNTICFEVTNGLIQCEEFVLSTLESVLAEHNIPLFGGSAGDKGKAEKTLISFNGQVYENACAFVIIKNLSGAIRLYRENIYKQTVHRFSASKVDIRKRIVYEYNYRPAAEAVAEALGVTVQQLPQYLDSHPMGRIIGNEMFITANAQVVGNKAMEYHARVYNNSQMVLLEPDDYRKVIDETLRRIKSEVPRPKFSLMVNCLARSILFENDGYLDEFGKHMGSALGDYVGIAGYGEQLNQQHFNQTMVVAVFE